MSHTLKNVGPEIGSSLFVSRNKWQKIDIFKKMQTTFSRWPFYIG